MSPELKAWLQANGSSGVLAFADYIEALAAKKAAAVMATRGDVEFEKGEFNGMMNVVRLTRAIIRSGTENDT